MAPNGQKPPKQVDRAGSRLISCPNMTTGVIQIGTTGVEFAPLSPRSSIGAMQGIYLTANSAVTAPIEGYHRTTSHHPLATNAMP